MHKQPVINIGMIGHVANGKSSIVKALTNTATQRHSGEKARGITIKTGYANAKIFKCNECETPTCYQATASEVDKHECNICGSETELVNHISFVDNPGHHSLMKTMMNGASVMDYAIIVESAENYVKNIGIPSAQTAEHYEITKQVGIETKIICMNKFDLVSKADGNILIDNFKKWLVTTNIDKNINILPISATMMCNIDILCEMLAQLKQPKRESDSNFKMLVIRSFNVNHPRTKINDLKGGVVGGSLMSGTIKVSDNVVIFPGFITRSTDGINRWKYAPLKSKILSINSEKTKLESAIPGGLIGIQLEIDPALTSDDKLVGQMIVPENSTDTKVYEEIVLDFKKMENIKGDFDTMIKSKLSVNINSNNIDCNMINITNMTNMTNGDGAIMTLELDQPIAVFVGDKVTVSSNHNSLTILGCGIIVSGKECIL